MHCIITEKWTIEKSLLLLPLPCLLFPLLLPLVLTLTILLLPLTSYHDFKLSCLPWNHTLTLISHQKSICERPWNQTHSLPWFQTKTLKSNHDLEIKPMETGKTLKVRLPKFKSKYWPRNIYLRQWIMILQNICFIKANLTAIRPLKRYFYVPAVWNQTKDLSKKTQKHYFCSLCWTNQAWWQFGDRYYGNT